MGAESYIFVEIRRFLWKLAHRCGTYHPQKNRFVCELTAVLELDRSLRSDVFFEHYEVQIVSERFAEAIVAVGEGAGFAGDGVASAFVP
jgi:hypothetical protein